MHGQLKTHGGLRYANPPYVFPGFLALIWLALLHHRQLFALVDLEGVDRQHAVLHIAARIEGDVAGNALVFDFLASTGRYLAGSGWPALCIAAAIVISASYV